MSFRDLGELKVLSGQTVSNSLPVQETNNGLGITAPATLAEAAGTLQVSRDNINWSNLHDGTANVVYPSAGNARIYVGFCFPYVRISLGGAAAADRLFHIYGSSCGEYE